MCDCVKTIEGRLLEKFSTEDRFKKPIAGVKLENVVFPFEGGKLSMKTSSTISVELEGQKRKKTVDIGHTFCPFCGKKYE